MSEPHIPTRESEKNIFDESMEVFHTAGDPPRSGVTIRPNSGCSTKISAALENSASAKIGAAARRARACMFPPESAPLLPSPMSPGNGLSPHREAIHYG